MRSWRNDTSTNLGAKIILWQHPWGPEIPRDRAALIERLFIKIFFTFKG